MTVGEQIGEALAVHENLPRRKIRHRVLDMLDAVQIREPERVIGLYPHEVSGGMGQRVMIAMMLIPEPAVLIADEPTSALDVSVQGDMLRLMNELITRKGMGLIFISHDLHLVSQFCDRIHNLFVANTLDEISRHFPDYELIGSLGCGSCINMPVIVGGKVLGTVNMLDVEQHFTPARIGLVERLRLPAVAAFLEARG